jgi:hypothetical protein
MYRLPGISLTLIRMIFKNNRKAAGKIFCCGKVPEFS